MKLTFPSGIPESVDSLKLEIQKQCGVEGEFRLQYMDSDSDQFMNLTSAADIGDKSTVKGADDSSADTNIFSSSL